MAEHSLKKDRSVFSLLQRIGRSFMLPIALLPVAGLLLGIGASFTNATMIEAYGLENILGDGTVLHAILQVMNSAGQVIFDNLPILFAMGVALGMAEKEKEVATLSAAIAYFAMNATINAMLKISGQILPDGSISPDVMQGAIGSATGIMSLQMGVFGGIIVGLGVAALHNRFYKIKLPTVLSFFGGTRFVPIISTVVYVLVGALMFFLWPFIQKGIYALGGLVLSSGYAGTFIYGVLERALIPFGLHHVFYLPFWQTGLGGSMMIDGVNIMGAQNIFFAQLASPTTQEFSVEATRFMTGKFPLMMFGLPGAALAMYSCAKSSKKKIVGGLLLSAALTAFLTGITEPLEFTFLFVAPALYAIHCVFAGLAYMLMHLLNVTIGMTFSGGVIDFLLFGVLQGNEKTNWLLVIPVGIAYFVIYYFLFRFLIKKFNLKTPGREDDGEETKLFTRKDVDARKNQEKNVDNKQATSSGSETSALILEGLGGMENIKNLDCCATRLRVTVNDSGKVQDSLLKQSGAAGVIHKGDGVQVIYGPRVTVIKSELEDYIDHLS
ncbi:MULTISPECIES: PTS transporter subunit EIIC [Clostridiaceae]|uniref:PTS transporter subunit EIIC n=1 Tax=Clostridium facile TaxID=2763035 RepID=A0ABR7ITC6_9CLOT|nr:PTS transporter subunit EIIC [Clostridium facile]